MGKTFGQAAAEVHAIQVGKWKAGAGYHDNAGQWLRSLQRHCRYIWAMPLHDIQLADAYDCLVPIWNTKRNISRRVRQRARQVFSHCMVFDRTLTTNPFGDDLTGALDVLNKVEPVRNHAATAWQSAPDVYAKLSTLNKPANTTNLIRVVMLTGVRVSEARLATWQEIDHKAGVWVIPGERTKMGREHRVPLSWQVLAILDKQMVIAKAKDSPLVFPNGNGNPLHLNTPLATIKLVDPTTTMHGLRATLRSWLEDTGADWRAAERCLAHVVGNSVEARYIRTDLLEQRAPLMQAWADYITQQERQTS